MEHSAQSTVPDSLSPQAHRFAEEANAGAPLRLYHMQPLIVSLFKCIGIMLYVATITGLVVGCIGFSIIQYRRITLPPDQSIDLLQHFSYMMPWTFTLMLGIATIFVRHTYKRELPMSVLVCSDGLLIIRPKGVEITYWDEVSGLSRTSTLFDADKSIMLHRDKREALTLSNGLADLDALADQIEVLLKNEWKKDPSTSATSIKFFGNSMLSKGSPRKRRSKQRT